MTLLLAVVGVAALWFPGRLGRVTLDTKPHRTARVAAAAITLGCVSLAGSLALAVTAAALLLGGPALEGLVAHLAPGGPLAAVLAGALLALLVQRGGAAYARLARARRSARPDPWLGRREDRGCYDVVLVPVPAPLAYGLTGPRDQIVVSQGLREVLDDEAFELVVRHEHAHLRGQHGRYLALATIVEAAMGWSRSILRSCAVLRLALERWADEEAAGHDHERRSLMASAVRRVQDLAQLGDGGPDPATVLRTEHLLRTPVRAVRLAEVVAVAVLVGLGAITAATTGHFVADVPAVVAAVR